MGEGRTGFLLHAFVRGWYQLAGSVVNDRVATFSVFPARLLELQICGERLRRASAGRAIMKKTGAGDPSQHVQPSEIVARTCGSKSTCATKVGKLEKRDVHFDVYGLIENSV